MSDKNIVLDVENVSKQYRLGEVGTGTLQHDLKRWWATVRGKEDPFMKIGETNDRTKKGDTEYVWALKDINFQIEQGKAVGIIGRNGAGKSTLLKLLSKVTKPTVGSIKYKGRIASLLEVGTGFHPEMTGRENIFLNGAILGMTRKEIIRKFDEIVAFAGVERYIDTPVKRYSSGMYVRLAFAVAAHLESEILIVDEVLAVGDAEFQKKCLGKMSDVTKGEGRTILFVSHNMTAIRNLCDTGIYMNHGMINYIGDIESSVQRYLVNNSEINTRYISNEISSIIKKMLIFSTIGLITTGKDLFIEIELDFHNNEYINLDLGIYSVEDELITIISTKYSQNKRIDKKHKNINCIIDKNSLIEGTYYINAFIYNDQNEKLEFKDKILQFEVSNGDYYNNGVLPNVAFRSKFLTDFKWDFK